MITEQEYKELKDNHVDLVQSVIKFNSLYKNGVNKISNIVDFISAPYQQSKIKLLQNNILNRWIDNKITIDFKKLRYEYELGLIDTDEKKMVSCWVSNENNNPVDTMLNRQGYLERQVESEILLHSTEEFLDRITKGQNNTNYYSIKVSKLNEDVNEPYLLLVTKDIQEKDKDVFNVKFDVNKNFSSSEQPNKFVCELLSDEEVYLGVDVIRKIFNADNSLDVVNNYDVYHSLGVVKNLLKTDTELFVSDLNTGSNLGYDVLMYFNFFKEAIETRKLVVIKNMEYYKTNYVSGDSILKITLPNDSSNLSNYLYKVNGVTDNPTNLPNVEFSISNGPPKELSITIKDPSRQNSSPVLVPYIKNLEIVRS